MRKIRAFIIYFLLPVSILGAIFFYGFGDNFIARDVLAVKSANSFLDFNTLGQSTSVFSETLVLENISGKDVLIKKIYTDCDCLKIKFSVNDKKYNFSRPVDLNEKPIDIFIPKDFDFAVQVEFVPNLEKGAFSGNLYFEPESGKVLRVKVMSNII